MATLAVVTNTGTSIALKTSDYASGFGDFYVWYSGAFATGHRNRIGEMGCALWAHGAAGFIATGSAADDTVTGQAGGGWDTGTSDGGILNVEFGSSIACTGPGADFSLADASNKCMMRVHLKGPTASTREQKYHTVWANGTHAAAIKVGVFAAANNNWFPNTTVLASYAANSRIPSGTSPQWGFSGTHLGVITAFQNLGKTWTSVNEYASNDGRACKGVSATLGGTNTISIGTVQCARMAVDGYDNAVTNAVVTAFNNDYITHSGTNKTLTVTTGSKITSGPDLFGTAGTSWTDGFSPQTGSWLLAASSNHVNLGGATAAGWGIDGTTVTKRFRPCFIMTGWTDTHATAVVTLGGSAQVEGADYEVYNDTGAQVLYLCLLKDIAGTEGALDITAPVDYRTRRTLGPRTGTRTARPVV
jgi:hypothetical protein